MYRQLVLALSVLPAAVAAHEAPKGSAATRAYIEEHVTLFETEATRIDTYRDKNLPAVRFAVKNTGAETLRKVEVTVYFLDRDGTPFQEKTYLPVLDNPYSIGDRQPLKPNYTFRMDAREYYTGENLGDEWSGEARFEVTDIEFAE